MLYVTYRVIVVYYIRGITYITHRRKGYAGTPFQNVHIPVSKQTPSTIQV
jgi:hypothetical protein